MIKPTDCLRANQCQAAQEQYRQVGWAISYDGGKTPYKMWHYDETLLDEEIKFIGGSASKMPLFAKVQE